MTHDDRRLVATVLAGLLSVLEEECAERVLGFIEATAAYLIVEGNAAGADMWLVADTARLMMEPA